MFHNKIIINTILNKLNFSTWIHFYKNIKITFILWKLLDKKLNVILVHEKI